MKKNRILTKKEQELFKFIISCNEEQLYNFLIKVLKKYGYTDIKTDLTQDYFILARGRVPIAVAAHLDTVFPVQPRNFFYDPIHNVAWSPKGGVGDDRLGIFLILELLRNGYRPHVIFTTEEEYGGVGAQELITNILNCPWPCHYIIELDRHGCADAVFYDCDNPDFTSYIESFGFLEAIGIFSDISVICPAWNIAGVNLSIGYINEHSNMEHTYFNVAFETLNKVEAMIDDSNNLERKFDYIPAQFFTKKEELLSDKY